MSDNLPEKNYGKGKSHSKAMWRNINKNNIQNQNSSLPNIKVLNNLKGPILKNIQIKNKENNNNNTNDNLKEQIENNNNNNYNKLLKKENLNISLSKNNVYNLENISGNIEKNNLTKEKSNILKSPPIQQKNNKYKMILSKIK